MKCNWLNQKGEPCPWNSLGEDLLYCKRHSKYEGVYTKDDIKKLKKCSSCRNMFKGENKICIACCMRCADNRIKTKNAKIIENKKCKGITSSQKPCNFFVKDNDDYCEKHQSYKKWKESTDKGIKICTNWVRGCFEEIKDDFSRCSKCRAKDVIMDRRKNKLIDIKKDILTVDKIDQKNNTKINKCLLCDNKANYNFSIEIKGKYCNEHKIEGMIKINKKEVCKNFYCNKTACFGYLNTNKYEYCNIHKENNMINLKIKKCVFEGCDENAYYNLENYKYGIYCISHKKENMINVCQSKCKFKDCKSIPRYNYITEQKYAYCKIHKLDNMVNLKLLRCNVQNCTKIAVFNYPDQKKAIYCTHHKEENMINLSAKQCTIDKCNKYAHYYDKLNKKLYCSEHKTDETIDIKYQICHEINCKNNANYNYGYEFKGKYCNNHKSDTMIHIKNNKCQEKNCNNKAIYGIIQQRKQYCNNHKKDNMVILDNMHKCSLCDNSYNFIVNNVKFCSEHILSKKHEVNLKKICRICDIEEYSNYICEQCKLLSHKKEYSIVRFIKKKIKIPFIHDSNEPVKECSNKRPDIFYDLLTHVLIVEIDENQHKTYSDICECARINNIVNSIGGKSVIFIRYNPDKIYNNKNEINIELTTKLNLLIKTISDEINKNYDNFIVKIIQLFYDDDNKIYQMKKESDITNIVSI